MKKKTGKLKHEALSPGMKHFLREQRIFCKASTIRAYGTALSSFDAFIRQRMRTALFSNEGLSRLVHEDLVDWIHHLHNLGLKPWSKINYFLPVRKYLAWEADRKTIHPETIERFTRSLLPKPPDVLPKPLSSENDKMLMDRLRTSNHLCAPFFLLLRFTGMRISELINLPNDCLQMTARGEAWLKVPLGKMNNERLVPLHDEPLRIVQNLRESKDAADPENDPQRLIGMRGAVPQVYAKLHNCFQMMTSDISDQGKPVTFHRLRHTYATSLLSAGVGIVSIMKLLGHRRIEMSLRYASITPALIRNEYFRAIKKLEQRSISADHLGNSIISSEMTPASLIDLLMASIKNDVSISCRSRYNFLKRLSRLKADLDQQIPAKFPIAFLPAPKLADLLAG